MKILMFFVVAEKSLIMIAWSDLTCDKFLRLSFLTKPERYIIHFNIYSKHNIIMLNLVSKCMMRGTSENLTSHKHITVSLSEWRIKS